MRLLSIDEAVEYDEDLNDREKRLLTMTAEYPMHRGRKTTRDEAMRDAYAGGCRAADLAERFGISERSVLRIVKDLNRG